MAARARVSRRRSATRCCGMGPPHIARAAAARRRARASARRRTGSSALAARLFGVRADRAVLARRDRARSPARPRRGMEDRRSVLLAVFALYSVAPLMVERSVQIVEQERASRPARGRDRQGSPRSSRAISRIARDDLEVNGKSIMGVMMLAAEFGSTLIASRRRRRRRAGASMRSPTLIASKFGETLTVDRALDRHSRPRPASSSDQCISCAGRCRTSATASSTTSRSPRRSSASHDAIRAREGAPACRFASAPSARRSRRSRDLRCADLASSTIASSLNQVESYIRQNLGAEKAFDLVLHRVARSTSRSTRRR